MTSKLGYVFAGLAVVVVAAAFFIGWYSGTKSDGTAPATSIQVASPAPKVSVAPPAVSAAPAQPQWVKTETYGSWDIRCQQPVPAVGSLCSAVLQISEKATGNALFAWVVTSAKNGLVTVLTTPTGVLIPSGVELKLGDSPPRRVGYANCVPQHCTAQIPIDEALKKEMLAGGKATVSIVSADGRGLEFAMSLAGFDKALAAISK